MIEFTVFGIPVAKARARTVRLPGGKVRSIADIHRAATRRRRRKGGGAG